ncbi:MAG: alpha/beta hydrolase [Lachnospiraceae bacterium]|nr:alpha/beta hydrolase [Lachnospiraceae bacterium]
MKSIYKSAEARAKILALYDRQLKELGIPVRDLYVETSFGRTHLVECGDFSRPPLLVFHGGNATTAYNLKYCDFLLPHFHIYAVDTIGHPGKSAETSLSPFNHDYGKWGREVIEQLGCGPIACLGGSFGGGILVKTMCAAPELVARSVLLVPSAIKNAPFIKSVRMLLPMCMYRLTHSEKWFIRCILPMAIRRENISTDILTTAKCSIDHARIKSIMPQNESARRLQKYRHPVLVMAAQRDYLFPAGGVLRRAKAVWPQCRRYLLRDRGQINELTAREKRMIIRALTGDFYG